MAQCKYNQKEMDYLEIQDLRVDVKCAFRDGLYDYMREQQKKLDAKHGAFAEKHGSHIDGVFIENLYNKK